MHFSSDDRCPVCYEDVSLISLECSHRICSSCKEKLRQRTCPMCRAPIESYQDTLIPADEIEVEVEEVERRRRRRRRRRWDNRVRQTASSSQGSASRAIRVRRNRTWSNDSDRQKRNARW